MLRVLSAAVTIGMICGASLAVAESAVRSGATSRLAGPSACRDTVFRIYFAPGEARLQGEALRLLDRASRDVAACAGVEVEVAAARSEVADASARRLAARRSAAIAVALRHRGVEGDVYVVPVTDAVSAAERNAGPDFIEVGLRPTPPLQIVRGEAAETS